MSISRIAGVRIAGLASAVPRTVVETTSLTDRFSEDDLRKIIKGTGVRRRRVAPEGMCTSDMCFAAGERLLDALAWKREEVDALVFVSQTPDYLLPATSCLLQHRLGLPSSCAAFDVGLGCSGYVYGLWLASHLVASGASKRCLLAVGEVSGRRIHPRDRSAVALFGDAGTVTALEATDDRSSPWTFQLGTDGAGAGHLIVPAGGCRLLPSPATAVEREYADGNPRSLNDLYMDGSEIFLFALDRVPPLIRETLAAAGWSAEQVEAFVLHQANEFMLKHVAKSMKLPLDKVPLILEDFGNTSSASIPLTMTQKLAAPLRDGPRDLLLAGFGVGLSWGAVTMRVGPVVVPPLVEVDEDAIPRLPFSTPGAPPDRASPEPA